MFADNPKSAARDSLAQLAALGIEVKIATGDNPRSPKKSVPNWVCPSKGTRHRGAAGADRRRRTRRRRPGTTRSSPGSRPSRRPARRVAAAHRPLGRLPRRRGQRRAGPALRRCRDIGRHRHRRGQGRGRRGAAGEGSRCARGGCRRGPAHLRQHDQVRPDGDVEQLRQHVQRRRGVGGAAVPADAARADPAQQPALRQRRSWRSPPTASTRSNCTRRRTGTSPSSAGSC